MESSLRLPRSPELMSRHDTALLVVDVQIKLIDKILGHQRLVWNIRRLIDAAELLGVPMAGTEQYPQGLGGTVETLAEPLGTMPAKKVFSCGACGQLFEPWKQQGRDKILLVGIETHVCVQQTCFDLLADGFRVFLAADAVGARFDIDHHTAIRRMEGGGATITTTESAMFEWCETADTPEFPEISKLVRQPPPTQ